MRYTPVFPLWRLVSLPVLAALLTGLPLAAQPTAQDLSATAPELRGDSLTRALLAGQGPGGMRAPGRVAQTHEAAVELALRPLPFRPRSPRQVGAYLGGYFRSQRLKALVVYRWLVHNIVHNIVYDQLYYQPAQRHLVRHNPTEVLLRGRGICSGPAWLAREMLAGAGLAAVFVEGKSKGTVAGSVPGVLGHAWNLVRIDGTWGNFDLTHFDPLYPDFDFLCDPDLFQRTHLGREDN